MQVFLFLYNYPQEKVLFRVSMKTVSASLAEAMNTIEAMTLLRLSYAECKNPAAIKRAWKIRMRVSHPDKNLHAGEEFTRLTQRINTAKDFLLTGLASGGYDDYEHSRWMASKREELARQKDALERQALETERRMQDSERRARAFACFVQEIREMEAKCARENAQKCKGPSLNTPHPMVRTWLEARRCKLAKTAC